MVVTWDTDSHIEIRTRTQEGWRKDPEQGERVTGGERNERQCFMTNSLFTISPYKSQQVPPMWQGHAHTQFVCGSLMFIQPKMVYNLRNMHLAVQWWDMPLIPGHRKTSLNLRPAWSTRAGSKTGTKATERQCLKNKTKQNIKERKKGRKEGWKEGRKEGFLDLRVEMGWYLPRFLNEGVS